MGSGSGERSRRLPIDGRGVVAMMDSEVGGGRLSTAAMFVLRLGGYFDGAGRG